MCNLSNLCKLNELIHLNNPGNPTAIITNLISLSNLTSPPELPNLPVNGLPALNQTYLARRIRGEKSQGSNPGLQVRLAENKTKAKPSIDPLD